MTTAPEFEITATGPVSTSFLALNISKFSGAAAFVRSLPYRRNTDKADLLCVLSESCGTCSTKHVLLKHLAAENNFSDLSLWTGIFRMNANNTPAIAGTLDKFK